jgi:hypothetical protein
VGKATIYRRWKSKEALFTRAIRSIALVPDAPDTGSVRADDFDLAVEMLLGTLVSRALVTGGDRETPPASGSASSPCWPPGSGTGRRVG